MDGVGVQNSEGMVTLRYEGSGNPIVITITPQQTEPVDYFLPIESPQYPFVVERTQVAGTPAIVDHQAFKLDDDVSVRFVRDGVLYVLQGRARTLEEVPALIAQLRRMAESLR